MIFDWLLYGLATWALATVLNRTVLKDGASIKTKWALSIVMFFVNLVALVILQQFQYQALSAALDLKLKAPGTVNGGLAFMFSWLFFVSLKDKSAPPIPAAAGLPTNAKRDIPQAAGRFCFKCGKPAPSEAIFCGSCGAPLEAADFNASPNVVPRPAVVSAERSAPESELTYCEECGAASPQHAWKCGSCGALFEEIASRSPNSAKEGKAVSVSSKLPWNAIIVLALLAFGVFVLTR